MNMTMKRTNQESIDYIKKMRQKFVDQLTEYKGGDRELEDIDDEVNLRKMIDMLDQIIKFMEAENEIYI